MFLIYTDFNYLFFFESSNSGDLVDAFPNWKELRAAQVSDLKSVLAELDKQIRIVCVCGNHDVGDIPTDESIEAYKREFGDDFFSFWAGGCKFIALNSQLYFNSSQVPHRRREQDEWLQKELERDQGEHKHLVVFQHIPLFIWSPDEAADVYFNIEPNQRRDLLERFEKAGVRKVFCGHYHQNAGGFYKDKLELVVTSAIGAQLGGDKHGFRVVDVFENEIKHEYVSVSDQVN